MQTEATAADLYSMAYYSYQGGRYEDAENFFRLLTSMDIPTPKIWMGLGAALQMQKKYQEAIDAYSAAALLEEGEMNPYPHAYAADCLHKLGDQQRARLALNSARQIANKQPSYTKLIEELNLLETRWFHNLDFVP